jgi:hypothetical protein
MTRFEPVVIASSSYLPVIYFAAEYESPINPAA